jgi:hypothetical protein
VQERERNNYPTYRIIVRIYKSDANDTNNRPRNSRKSRVTARAVHLCEVYTNSFTAHCLMREKT